MLEVVNNPIPGCVHIPEDMPTIPGIISIITGMNPGELGIYGPTRKETYTYTSTPVDLDQYSYDVPIYHPLPVGEVHLNSFLISKGWASKAWAEVGSWGMVFLNVRARQANGIICPTMFHTARDQLIRLISKVHPGIEIYRTEELWNCTGVPPDLLVRLPGYQFYGDGDNIVENY